MAIDFEREEYRKMRPEWKLIDDMCTEHNLADHVRDLDVLADQWPISDDSGNVIGFNRSPDQKRNRDFKRRASFFGASRMTLESLIGMAFERDPQITVPPQIEYLTFDADGSGVDLWQQMQEATGEALKKGRGGLYITMPPTDDAGASLADQEALRAVATINLITAERIVNWWTARDGADTYLAGIVFKDSQEFLEDYEIKTIPGMREIALDEAGNAFDRLWIKSTDNTDGEKWVPQEPQYLFDGRRQNLKRIPFLFFGARRNHWDIQVPPMISLARKNRDHLNNSAINEEGIWFSGHIQPVADEMDPEAFDVMGRGFQIGAGHLMVAKGFRYEVAEPNTAARQGMMDKAEEMAALGAKFMQPGTVAKTATEAAGEQRTQHSVLSLVSVNIEDAYQWACEKVAMFMGVSGEIEIKLNRSFMDPVITAEKMREMRENMLAGVIGPSEMYRILQRAGDIDPEKTEEEYLDEMAERGLIRDATI